MVSKSNYRKAIGYVRVSTDMQASEGVSLDAQRAKLGAWAELNDCDLIDVQTDAGLSGGRADNRPGLQAALDAVCRAKGVLVVYSLSRLARSTKDTLAMAERLAKAGADLVSLSERIDTTTAAGKMVFRMLAVLAEFERDQISERTRLGLGHKKSKGQRVGTIPFGYTLATDGVHLEPLEAEQEIIRRMHDLRAEGMTYRQIGSTLEAEGIRPKGGTRWHVKVVWDICRRPVPYTHAAGRAACGV